MNSASNPDLVRIRQSGRAGNGVLTRPISSLVSRYGEEAGGTSKADEGISGSR